MRAILPVSAALLLTFALCGSGEARQGGGSMFADADANHDGIITKAEFQASREQRFDRLDRNHDGVITQDDLSGSRFGANGGDRMMKLFDRNGDGKIEKAEFVGVEMRFFDRADTNHDGSLSQDEVDAAQNRQGAGAGGGDNGGGDDD